MIHFTGSSRYYW